MCRKVPAVKVGINNCVQLNQIGDRRDDDATGWLFDSVLALVRRSEQILQIQCFGVRWSPAMKEIWVYGDE